MSVTKLSWRALATATVPALAGLVACGLVAAPAQAAAAKLHVTGTVSIGKVGASVTPAFGEAPDGVVYFSLGRKVYAVNGTSAPVLRVTAGGTVLALAANSTGLFVTVSRTVTEYQRSNGAEVRRWRLRSPLPPTSAGLYAAGSTVWAWTDWATDQSGFEYANVSRLSTGSPAVHKVSYGVAYPADMAAGPAGLYYEAVTAQGTNGYLVHVWPSGRSQRVTDRNLPGPLALAGGRVGILAVHFSHGRTGSYIDGYAATTLAHAYSRKVSSAYRDLAGTGAGLLALTGPCSGIACQSATVNLLYPSNGGFAQSVAVRYGLTLLTGPSAVVVTDQGGTYSLVRLAA